MENLLGAISSVLSGKGRCVILSGEAGIGKSRLIEELGMRTAVAGFTVLQGQCHSGNRTPFGGFLDVIRGSLDLLKAPSHRPSIRSEDRQTARSISLLEDFVSGRLDLWRPDPYIKGDRIRYSALDTITAIAKGGPALIVVEDLQWADTLTVELFQMLARTCRDAKVLLIGTYRTEEMEKGTNAPAWEMIGRMMYEGMATEIELNRMTIDEIDKLVPSLLGNDIDVQVYRLIEASSEGNPLLIIELLRNMTETGAIVEADEYWMVDPSKKAENITTSLDGLLLDQLKRLNWMEGRVMEISSMIGMDIDQELLAEVLGAKAGEVLQVLKEVAAKTSLLVITFHGFQFRHNKVREILYERIPDDLRKELHLALAESLERLHHVVDRKAELAWHYRHTDHNDKCIEYSLASAESMLNVYALDEALEMYDISLQKGKGPFESIGQKRKALEGAGICLEEKGEYDRAGELFNSYLETCPLAKDRARVLLRLIECWEPSRLGLGSLEPKKLLMDHLLQTCPLEGLDLARMNDMLANIHNWENRFEEVLECRKRAAQIYLESGQMEKYALDLSFSVYALLSLERLEEAGENVVSALSIYEEHPYNYGIMDAEMRSAEVLMYLGQDDESISHYEKSAKIAAEIGEYSMEYLIRCYISMQQLEMMNEEAARLSLKRSEQVARLAPSRFAMGCPMAYQAHLEARTGHAVRAIALAETALKILEEYKFPRPQRAMALLGYAEALYGQCETEKSLQMFDEALKEIRNCPTSTIYEARAYWWMANSMIEKGDNTDARIMLQKARPIFERIDNYRMMKIIDETLVKISLAESVRSNITNT